MLRRIGRNWPILVSLAAVLVMLGLAGLQNNQENSSSHHQATAEEARSASKGAAVPIQRPPPAADPNPNRQEWREEQDLNAQRDMAKWAIGMLIVSGFGVVVGLIGLVLLKRTLDATLRADNGFRVSAEKQLRAYLSATAQNFALKADLTQIQPIPVNVEFQVVVKNHGQTPARNVRVWSVVGFRPWPITQEYVASFREELTHNAVIMPGQEREFTFEQDVRFHSEQLWSDPPHTFFIFGIVRYLTIEGARYTRFCGGLKGAKDWYLHARNGDIRPVKMIATEHSNDAD